MKELLDINSWSRKSHFDFFKKFEEPYFGVCVNIDCSRAYVKCKEENISFFLFYLHKALVAANKVRPFRLRIEDDKVYIYDKIHASPTIKRPDGTFGFSYMNYFESFQQFKHNAQKVIEHIQSTSGLKPAALGENVIHFTSLPWIDFTSMSHARRFSFKDSCPKISFGKMTQKEKTKKMPVSIHVHHALMDGYHVGEYINMLQELMEQADHL